MNSNTRNFLEIGLAIALLVGGIFLFNQKQNLDTTRDDLAVVQSDGTQIAQAASALADEATAMADSAASDATEAANQLSDANATATQAANESADALDSANSTIADVESELSDANATATQAANESADALDSANSTIADIESELSDANATATQAANESADALESANADATQAASDAESTLSSVEADALSQANRAATQEAAAESENDTLAANLADSEATSDAMQELQMTEQAVRDDLEEEVAGLSTAQAVANEMADVQLTTVADLATSLTSANETGDAQIVALADAEATIAVLEAQVAAQSIELSVVQQDDAEATEEPQDSNLPTNTGETNTAGLIRYETATIEIYLPADYIAIDPAGDEMAAAITMLESLGDDYQPFIAQIQQNPDLMLLFAVRDQVSPDGFVENMNILATDLPVQVPLQSLMLLLVQGYPETFTVLEQDIVEMNGQDIIRIVTDIDFGLFISRGAQYVFLKDNTIYIVTIGTSPDEFEERLAVFESIAATFRVLDE
ncbi:MAG: hypothetical protein Q9P01_05465 [Anaerolineae bacterium]|nr:hypothetical protein [Anaerolineae bacterium]MDQ7034287.1 hypothetical protein [Anaerolineae bacterium]